jgi:transposase
MDAHENTPRIEVLSVTDTGRRRRWTDDEKVRIVEESHRGGETLAEVARRHEISRSQLYDWRYRYKHGLLVGCGPGFMRVLPVEGGSGSNGGLRPLSSVMTIDLGAHCRVTVPADYDMDAVAHLLDRLKVMR